MSPCQSEIETESENCLLSNIPEMAPLSGADEIALMTVQQILASLYEHIYPCSNTVQQGLDGILIQRYGGCLDDFTDQFIRPTLSLLEKLKVKGFPLVKRGKVIVHLLPPSHHLESGEMFYQVGHTTPGTLALKFSKYHGDTLVLQPATIQETDFPLAFTQQHINKVRNKALSVGNEIMRVLLTSIEDHHGVMVTEKTELKSVMPYSVGKCASSSSLAAVLETGSSRSSLSKKQIFHQPNAHSQSGSSVDKIAPRQSLTQDVMEIRSAKSTGHTDGKFSCECVIDSAHPTAFTCLEFDSRCLGASKRNLALSSPSKHALKNDRPNQCPEELSARVNRSNQAHSVPMQAVCNEQLKQSPSNQRESDTPYPPLIEAVRGVPIATPIRHQLDGHSLSVRARSPPHPHQMHACAVSDDPGLLRSENSSTDGDHEQLKPLQHVILSCKKLQKIRRVQSRDANLKESLQLQQDALDHILLSCRRSSDPSKEHSTSGNLFRQSNFPSGRDWNSPYPPLTEAVKEGRPGTLRDDPRNYCSQSNEHFPSGRDWNSPYPPLVEAVKEDRPGTLRDDQSRSLSGSCQRNYCSLSNEHFSSGRDWKSPYPPLMETVKGGYR